MKRLLGQKIEYSKFYDSEQLRRELRSTNRMKYDLHDKNLPFIGYDIWHCWEISFLTNNSLPVSKVGKLKYPSSSKYIVESKSLKLYLNSFNMTMCGSTYEKAETWVKETIIKDLSELLKCKVELEFFDGTDDKKPYYQFPYYTPNDSLKFTQFKESPEVLEFYSRDSHCEFIFNSDLLRSNCPITKQPDWGDIFIYMFGKKIPDLNPLFQYIVSFRSENHFHEEVVEMIYKRLWDLATPERLMVGAIYTRRGGIDICPCRASHEELLDKNLININFLTDKLARQ